MYQLALLWEAVFNFSEFFWRLFQCVCPFQDGRFTSTPAHTELSVQQFLTKNCMTPMPHPPYSPDLTLSDFLCLFPWVKIVLKEKRFADVEEEKQESGISTKRHLEALKIDKFKSCFEQREKNLNRCSRWRVLWRWLKFKHIRINTPCFINKFQGFWVPPCICWMKEWMNILEFLERSRKNMFI